MHNKIDNNYNSGNNINLKVNYRKINKTFKDLNNIKRIIINNMYRIYKIIKKWKNEIQ